MLSNQEARQLATRVAKESNGVSVRIAATNGRNCLHLIHRDLKASNTIYEVWEWAEHPWNRHSGVKRRDFVAEAQTALAAA